MKPLVPYHGGKGRLADWITDLIPPHRVYVEPFAGSAAVLLAKPVATHEILNDLDSNAITFYRVLRERPDDLELACRLTPYARDEFLLADLDDFAIDDLERARRWWIRTSQSFNHTAGGKTGWATSINRGSNSARTVLNRLVRPRPGPGLRPGRLCPPRVDPPRRQPVPGRRLPRPPAARQGARPSTEDNRMTDRSTTPTPKENRMKVQINLDRSGSHTLVIDGVDMTKHVLHEGFYVQLLDNNQPLVHLVLRPDTVEIQGDARIVLDAIHAASTEGAVPDMTEAGA